MNYNLGLSKLNLDEMYEYASQTTAIVKAHGAQEVAQSVLFVALGTTFGRFDLGYKKTAKSMLTESALEVDALRDGAAKGTYYTLMGLTFSEDGAVASAAMHLLAKLDTYGGLNLPRMAHKEESAGIKGLLNDFKRPEYAADVVTTKIGPWLDTLDRYQKRFDDIDLNRTEENQEKDSVEAAASVRVDLEKDIRKLRTLVEGMALVDAESEWAKVNGLLNQLDGEYAQKLRTRATNSAKKREEDKLK